jgi:hypothetical protein
MKRNLTRVKVLALVSASLVLISWANTLKDVEEASRTITSIQADFTQTKNMALLSRPLVSTGSFHYQQPGSLRWEYRSPLYSVLLLHRGSLRRYIRGKQGLVADDTARLQSMALVLQEISAWFGGRFDQNPDFSARLTGPPSRRIILTPKSDGLKSIIAAIKLKLSDRPGVIEEVTIREGENNTTVLSFTGIVLNARSTNRSSGNPDAPRAHGPSALHRHGLLGSAAPVPVGGAGTSLRPGLRSRLSRPARALRPLHRSDLSGQGQRLCPGRDCGRSGQAHSRKRHHEP